MSKIGNKNIIIPENIQIYIDYDINSICIKKELEYLNKKFLENIIIICQNNKLFIFLLNEKKNSKKYHGMYRNVCYNMIYGIKNKYSKILLINGIGYKFQLENNILKLFIGFSHPISIDIPKDINVILSSPSKLIITGINKERIGFFTSIVRRIRPPEPYGCKGIKYEFEIIQKKIGKKDRKSNKN